MTKAIEEIRRRSGLTLSEGNKKLVPQKNKFNFLIFNLPAVITCPYSTEMCRACCYALKAEKQYKTAREARRRNYAATLSNSFVADMLELIAAYMERPKYQKIPCYFRIHESGDFYSRDYFQKWLTIIKTCQEKYPNIKFNFYTKSIDYIGYSDQAEFIKDYPNAAPNISIWEDTPARTCLFAMQGNWNIYTAATPENLKTLLKIKQNKQCRCSDCGTCKMCLINHKTNLTKICEIH